MHNLRCSDTLTRYFYLGIPLTIKTASEAFVRSSEEPFGIYGRNFFIQSNFLELNSKQLFF